MVEKQRRYRHAVIDSDRWVGFEHRPDDIVISTSMKAGTTWMQGIMASLLWPADDAPGPLSELTAWIDACFGPVEPVWQKLAAQQHRRFIKTHLPADGLPLRDDVRYVVVGRDGRDVFMSLLNHWEKMRPDLVEEMNVVAVAQGIPALPLYDGDVHKTFDTWISQGAFPWEGDGAPWWSHFSHAASWWAGRERPNVLFVHYGDMLADLETEMRRVASFCDIDVPDDAWPAITSRCTIDEMRERADRNGGAPGFIGGAKSFFFKGTNGRWRSVLTDDELARYEQRVAEVLSPEAATWLEHGRHGRPSFSA
jgi:aryl sulfotransferase